MAGVIEPSGDILADMDKIRDLLSDIRGYKPEKQIPIRLKEEVEE
jgi:hypothetical protein